MDMNAIGRISQRLRKAGEPNQPRRSREECLAAADELDRATAGVDATEFGRRPAEGASRKGKSKDVAPVDTPEAVTRRRGGEGSGTGAGAQVTRSTGSASGSVRPPTKAIADGVDRPAAD